MPVFVFGKNVNNTGSRNAFMAYTDTLLLLLVIIVIQILQIHEHNNFVIIPLLYLLQFESFGYVRMQYGFGQGSDERITTNIKTIEYAFERTLLLRSVVYNDIRI